MPQALIDGFSTHYEVLGSGPPLLMFSPGGFDATLQKWSTLGVYARINLLDHLTLHYSCILFDRRETGLSGGRVEPISWSNYVTQGKGLLDHLGIAKAHLLGGCMGCAPAVGFAVAHPRTALSMVLYWPVGGAKYRINGQQRFARHLDFVREHGLAEVVALARTGSKSFGEDPRGGPWVAVLRRDESFAAAYLSLDLGFYLAAVGGMRDALLDRDTAPGAEPEAMLQLETPTLVVPGRDASHATSAARYLEECLPKSEYWDVPPEAQTEANAPQRILEFLAAIPN